MKHTYCLLAVSIGLCGCATTSNELVSDQDLGIAEDHTNPHEMEYVESGKVFHLERSITTKDEAYVVLNKILREQYGQSSMPIEDEEVVLIQDGHYHVCAIGSDLIFRDLSVPIGGVTVVVTETPIQM